MKTGLDPAGDDAFQGLPGARTTPAISGAETFCATPLIDLLRRSAAREPDAVALSSLTASLTYGDLLRLAETAASTVAERVPPGAAVACLLPRQPISIAAILGCLIAGRPCLIIDAADPRERRNAVLADAAPALVLSTEPIAGPYPILTPDELVSGPHRRWEPDQVWDPDAPFAIHFTSGSTGRPKGIVLSARSALYRGLFSVETTEVTAESRVLQPTAPVANGGLTALLGVLARGGRLVMVDLAREGASATLRLIEREAVTHASFGPSTLRALSRLRQAPTAFRTLRVLRLGESAVTRADLDALRSGLPRDCVIVHAYASSEALFMAQWVVPADYPGDEARRPAGIVHLCHDYALRDEDGGPAAPGQPGELVLRSRYLALGEWQAGRLVPGRLTPVPGRPGWRWFRTGDMARVGADGMLRVLGRVDRQVKINGILVQPAEIETVLKSEPEVIDAAVVARSTLSEVTLHGFVAATVADGPALVARLRRRLAENLPMALRPARLTVLDRLPETPAGKVDLVGLSRLAAM